MTMNKTAKAAMKTSIKASVALRPLLAVVALACGSSAYAQDMSTPSEGWFAPPPMWPVGNAFDFGLVESSPNAVWHMNFPTADAQVLQGLAREVVADPAPVATLQRAAFSETEFSRSARVLREAAYHPTQDPVYLSPVAMRSDVADVWQVREAAAKPAADLWRVDPLAAVDNELDALLRAPLRSLRSTSAAAVLPIPEPCKPNAPVAEVQGASAVVAANSALPNNAELGLTAPAQERPLLDPLQDPLLSDPLVYLRPQLPSPVRAFGFAPIQPFTDRAFQRALPSDSGLRNAFMPSYALGVRHANSMNPLAQMPYTQQHSRYYGFP